MSPKILQTIFNSPKNKRKELIDNIFDFDKINENINFYFEDSKYICNDIFNLIFKEDYDIEKMRIKFNNYINKIKYKNSDQLSIIFIIPFKVIRKEGKPVYEQEKFYINGERRYKGYIHHYKFYPYLTTEIDIDKIDNISDKINNFFDYKIGKKTQLYLDDEEDFIEYMYEKILKDHCSILSESSKIDDSIEYDFPC